MQAASHRRGELCGEMDAREGPLREAKRRLWGAWEAVFERLGAAVCLADVLPPLGPPPGHGGGVDDNWWKS